MRFSSRLAAPLVAALLTTAASSALAQVQVQSLAPPDLFSTPAGAGDLGGDLWKETAPDIFRDVLPKLAAKPLSPAFAELARKVLATGANAPTGVGDDPDMGAARALGLLALGDAAGAGQVLDRAPGVAANASLSLAAAEAALIKGEDDKACQIGEALTVDRGAGYWLRLRAFCQARAGQDDAAHLTFTLAQQQTPKQGGGDADYARLMAAVLNGATPGAANLRNGINLALSRKLGLSLKAPAATATASPAIRNAFRSAHLYTSPLDGLDLTAAQAATLAALRQSKTLAAFIDTARDAALPLRSLAQANAPLEDPVLFARAAIVADDLPTAQLIRSRLVQDQIPGATAADLALLDAMISAASGKPDNATLDRLIERGAQGGAKSPAQPAALLLAALGGTMGPEERGQFAGFEVGKSTGSPARLALVEDAAVAGRKGEAALLALSVAAEAGAGGPVAADRARLAQALTRAGLASDARAVVVEGLLALTLVPVPPTK